MAHTYANNFVHCVFSTKERANTIPEARREQLWAYLVGVAKNEGFSVLAACGTANHVHALILLPASISSSDAVKNLKSNSSRWMGPRFAWQEGYGAFSVSPSQLPDLKAYIANQPEHHKKRNFEEEFIALLKKCEVDYDPKFVFG
ncbi:MAG TPA: transposase [Terriglobales bacterium]|nr:transposase [Terriglobales bacterium]